jgi:hypothetical protein
MMNIASRPPDDRAVLLIAANALPMGVVALVLTACYDAVRPSARAVAPGKCRDRSTTFAREARSMGGKRWPGTCGPGGDDEPIDEGTAALMCMPPPAAIPCTPATGTWVAGASTEPPMSGGIPYAIGQSSVVRIPIPGTNGLAIELRPRGFTPTGGSTSTLFFQDVSGRRHLRLDYGYNVRTRTIDYHWNQRGTHAQFGIPDHAPAGQAGELAYGAAKYFRYAGRVLLVAGVIVDAVSIVQASNPVRRASQVVAGWAAAWAGCEVVGAGGAALGSRPHRWVLPPGASSGASSVASAAFTAAPSLAARFTIGPREASSPRCRRLRNLLHEQHDAARFA